MRANQRDNQIDQQEALTRNHQRMEVDLGVGMERKT